MTIQASELFVMGMSKSLTALVLLLVVVSTATAQKRPDRTFSTPGSALLFQKNGRELLVATPSGTVVLKPPIDLPANGGIYRIPGLSPDGRSVVDGFVVDVESAPKVHAHFVIAVRRLEEPTWKRYGDFGQIGVSAFSPDGSRIAFTSESDGPVSLSILKLSTGEISSLSFLSRVNLVSSVGWSPDGGKLVVERINDRSEAVISIADLGAGTVRDIGAAQRPSWSPTGEWIAYMNAGKRAGETCILVHPDGTAAKVVRDLRKEPRLIRDAAVWSPDGSQLLLNEWNDFGVDLTLVDLGSRKAKRIYRRRALPVSGWATLKQ